MTPEITTNESSPKQHLQELLNNRPNVLVTRTMRGVQVLDFLDTGEARRVTANILLPDRPKDETHIQIAVAQGSMRDLDFLPLHSAGLYVLGLTSGQLTEYPVRHRTATVSGLEAATDAHYGFRVMESYLALPPEQRAEFAGRVSDPEEVRIYSQAITGLNKLLQNR